MVVDGVKLTGELFERKYYAGGNMKSETWKVPAGAVFLLADNSRNALDSRHWGFIDTKSVYGVVKGKSHPSQYARLAH